MLSLPEKSKSSLAKPWASGELLSLKSAMQTWQSIPLRWWAQERFRASFPNKVSLLAVMRVQDEQQTLENMKIATQEGLSGLFLNNHGISRESLMRIVRKVREKYQHWMGVHMAAFSSWTTFEKIKQLHEEGARIDGIWVDHSEAPTMNPENRQDCTIREAMDAIGWKGLYFGGDTSAHDEQVPSLSSDSQGNKICFDVITVNPRVRVEWNGISFHRIQKIRKCIGFHPLAVTDGVSHANIEEFLRYANICIAGHSLLQDENSSRLDVYKVRKMAQIVDNINTSFTHVMHSNMELSKKTAHRHS